LPNPKNKKHALPTNFTQLPTPKPHVLILYYVRSIY
jgi:hypothetical protein